MIKFSLFVVGFGGLGYALYNYYNKQLKFAMDWEFDVKDMKVISIDSNGAEIDFLISLLNKSSFSIDILDYDIDILYKGYKIGNAKSKESFTVQPQDWFDVDVVGQIDFNQGKKVIGEIGLSLFEKSSLKIDAKGKMNVVFSGIDREVIFNKKDIIVSDNLAKDLFLESPVNEINKLLDKIGIKL